MSILKFDKIVVEIDIIKGIQKSTYYNKDIPVGHMNSMVDFDTSNHFLSNNVGVKPIIGNHDSIESDDEKRNVVMETIRKIEQKNNEIEYQKNHKRDRIKAFLMCYDKADTKNCNSVFWNKLVSTVKQTYMYNNSKAKELILWMINEGYIRETTHSYFEKSHKKLEEESLNT